jgi:hypothetical protein
MSDILSYIDRANASLEVENDYVAINDLFHKRGWTDGFPIIPPTTKLVEEMLSYCDRPWDRPIAKIAPRYGEATPIRLATNAVMAGCRPEYFPVVVAAIEALCEEPFNLYGLQATTHLVSPLIIVNGPIAKELGINSGYNALGSGCRSNATIGRAVRLSLVNIGGAQSGAGDMATFGSPAKYSYLAAENEADSPWEPLHVERGFSKEASTVTVIGAECPHNVNDHQSITGVGILKMIAGTMATTGNNDVYNLEPHPAILIGPEHAKTIAADGFSKADVKRYMFEHAVLPLQRFSQENIDRRFLVTYKDRYGDANSNVPVPMVQRAEDILVVVIGGPGKHSAVIPTFGVTVPITREIKLANENPASSVEEFKVASNGLMR